MNAGLSTQHDVNNASLCPILSMLSGINKINNSSRTTVSLSYILGKIKYNKRLFIIIFFIPRVPELFTSYGGRESTR